MIQNHTPKLAKKNLEKNYKWWYLFLSLFVILLVYRFDLDNYYLGIRSVYWPIIGLWVFFKIETFFFTDRLQDNYYRYNLKTIRLNLYLILVFLLVFTLVFFMKWSPQGDLTHLNRGIPNSYFPFLYAFLSAPIQQDLFFGELYNRLKDFSGIFKYLLVALFYSLTHIYYPEPQLILLTTFGLGLYWAYCRQKSQSILGNILSHIIIGLIAFYLNFA